MGYAHAQACWTGDGFANPLSGFSHSRTFDARRKRWKPSVRRRPRQGSGPCCWQVPSLAAPCHMPVFAAAVLRYISSQKQSLDASKLNPLDVMRDIPLEAIPNAACCAAAGDWGHHPTELAKRHAGRVLLIGATPHGWLFPRCACVVHHGGQFSSFGWEFPWRNARNGMMAVGISCHQD